MCCPWTLDNTIKIGEDDQSIFYVAGQTLARALCLQVTTVQLYLSIVK